jgi:hypothetical protein
MHHMPFMLTTAQVSVLPQQQMAGAELSRGSSKTSKKTSEQLIPTHCKGSWISEKKRQSTV